MHNNTHQSLLTMQFLILCWEHRKIILRNVIVTVVFVSIFSLIMPITFKSTAVLMPPKSNSDNTMFPNIGEIALGNILTTGTDGSNTIFAILKSRTMAELVINEMNMIEIYRLEDMDEAVKTFQKNLILRDLEEGTISVSALTQTSWMSSEKDREAARHLSVDIVRYIIGELDRVNKLLQTDEAHYQRLFLEKRYNEIIRQLKTAEEELRIFQNKHNTLDLIEQTKAAINIGAQIKSQILIEEVKLGVLSKTYNSDHPEIEKLKMQIAELEYQLSTLDYNADNSLKNDNNIFPKYSEVPNLSIDLMRLQREVEIQSALYLFLSEKYESSKIEEARDTPTIQVLDDANYPIKRYKPMRTLMVIGYSLIMLVLSAIYIILIAFNKNEISDQ